MNERGGISVRGGIGVAFILTLLYLFVSSALVSIDVIASYFGIVFPELFYSLTSFSYISLFGDGSVMLFGVLSPLFYILLFLFSLHSFMFSKRYKVSSVLKFIFLLIMFLLTVYVFIYINTDKKTLFIGEVYSNFIYYAYFLGGNVSILLIAASVIAVVMFSFPVRRFL